MDKASCSYSTETTRETIARQLNESVYELYKPPGQPSVQIIFFHGFQLREGSDPHLSTWMSGDDSSVWPQTWLAREFPDAHVFTVAYKAELLRDSKAVKVDMYIIAENIISDLLQAKIGENARCPIVLVGHSFGGLVMKELCLQAQKRGTYEHEKFLSAVKGFFFYSTPHHGIPSVGIISRFLSDSPLLKYVETLSESAARMNDEFERLRNKYGWLISGVGENLCTKLGSLGDLVQNPFPAFRVVPEASARYGDFNLLPNADHITVCKPMLKSSRSFNKLTMLLQKLSISSVRMACPGNFQLLPEVSVGLEDTLDTLKMKLLESTSLGLAGMGGIGKSSLAKALFNVLEFQYEYTCFIRDVKNVTKSKEIVKAIVSNLHHWGKWMPKETEKNLWFLKGKRLLLILDDVASGEKDLEIVRELQNIIVTHKDSRFVATSRDSELLKRCLDDVIPVELLSLETSRNLFLSHAFPKGGSPSFACDIDGIVKMCGQLPLALEVTGKHLNGKGQKIWGEAQIALSRRQTIHGLQGQLMSSLRLSYDGLDEQEKQMFLDAGTFFHQKSLREAKSVWSMTTNGSQETRWLTLVNLSLVSEEKDIDGIRVRMHEQLRSLASEISSTPRGDGRRIDGESAWNVLLGNGSSLDDVKDIVALDLDGEVESRDIREGMVAVRPEKIGCFHSLDRLKKHVLQWFGGMTEVEGMERLYVPRSVLFKMGNLRYLRLYHVDVDDTHDAELPSTIVCLELRDTSSSNFPFDPACHKRMTVLDLFVIYLCTLPCNFGQLSGLQILRIGCKLRSLPDSFGELLCLEELRIYQCEFVKLPETFGRLIGLKTLEFSGVRKLKALPQSFGHLSQLESLDLLDCDELEALPESFGQLRSLKKLKVLFAGKLKALPQSFGELSQLESLVLGACAELEALPESFGQLRSLKKLQVALVQKLKALPQSFGELSQLESLDLDGCHELEALPDSFGQLRSLKELGVVSAKKLKALPQSFGELSQLESLVLDFCAELEALPDSFGQLRSLKKLKVRWARKLKALPQSFGELSQLESLVLGPCTELEALPESFGQLRSLKQLEVRCAEKLKALPQSFGELSQLEELTINDCIALSTLPDSCGRLAMLKKLSLKDGISLSVLPGSLGGLPMLKEVEIKDCAATLKALPESLRTLHRVRRALASL